MTFERAMVILFTQAAQTVIAERFTHKMCIRDRLPDNILIDVEQLRSYPDEQTVIITTGSQGESMAALSRMANGTHLSLIHI